MCDEALTGVTARVGIVREVDGALVHGEHGARDSCCRVGHVADEQSPPRIVMMVLI